MRKDQVIGGYVLIDEIGSGGMGEVWTARQPGVGRIVVIKGLKEGFQMDRHEDLKAPNSTALRRTIMVTSKCSFPVPGYWTQASFSPSRLVNSSSSH